MLCLADINTGKPPPFLFYVTSPPVISEFSLQTLSNSTSGALDLRTDWREYCLYGSSAKAKMHVCVLDYVATSVL